MRFDSSAFDIRKIDSCKINMFTPLDVGEELLDYIAKLIQTLPENEKTLEVCIRSIVNVLIISKLQSDHDRFELDLAKQLIISGHNKIIRAKPITIGEVQVVNLERWSIFSLKQPTKSSSLEICDDISSIIDEVSHLPHLIFDLSGCTNIDLNLIAYLIGLRDMLQKSNRKMSIAWLHHTAVSPTLLKTLVSRFNLFKKGAFLLSTETANNQPPES